MQAYKAEYQYGWNDQIESVVDIGLGLSQAVAAHISDLKREPKWMADYRKRGYQAFVKRTMPKWGPDLGQIDFQNMCYYRRPTKVQEDDWQKVPKKIRETYVKLGIPEAERQRMLGGVSAQYESEVVYKKVIQELSDQGVIFSDMDSGLRKHQELVKKYWGTVVGVNDNKFAALNSAVWSGGSFIYVPKGVKVKLPLQAYFRINAAKMGQFERTMIIADEGSFVHYVEGCSAPIYTENSLHAAVVEIIVKPGARVRYTTIQNWSNNVFNLVTKRARVEENGTMEWVDANLGSGITMKYPACILAGTGAKGEVTSLAFAGQGQVLDTGAKMIHLAANTTGTILSKSISKDGGASSFRGLVKIAKGAVGAKSKVKCEALILDQKSQANTYPQIEIGENQVEASHEAITGKLNEDQIFYLMSRGVEQHQAETLLVNGFIEPIVKELPLEYAVELNRLIQLEMEGSVG